LYVYLSKVITKKLVILSAENPDGEIPSRFSVMKPGFATKPDFVKSFSA